MTYVDDMEAQNERLAQLWYDQEKKALANFGPRPIDPETGEGMAKTPSAEVLKMHALVRKDNDLFGLMVAKEAARIGLSPGILPKRWWHEMLAIERQFQGYKPPQGEPADAL